MSPKKVTKPVDVYIRVSATKGRTGESFQSPAEQEQKCRAALEARGLEVGQVFTELDVSGKTMQRPELTKVLQRIEDGASGGVVVARIDRFGRTIVGALETLERIDKAGGVVLSAEGDLDTSTATGELVLNMMLTLAQFELRRIRETWEASKRNAVARGIHVTRHVPPGYIKDDGGRLKPHPKHGQTITKAYAMAAQGSAPSDIARYLNERELPSGDNPTPTWRSSRVGRLLANRVYLGEARANDAIVNREAHPPLTDEATWLRAQRKPVAQPLSASTALLTGLVRCASCRHSMKPQKASKHAVATYRCPQTGSRLCPHPSTISAERLEDIVFAAYTERVFSRQGKPVEHDDSEALAVLEDARQALAEVEAAKDEVRPEAYMRALDAALADVEAAEAALRSRQALNQPLSEQDMNDLLYEMDFEFSRIAAGGRPLEGVNEGGRKILRYGIAKEVAAVFIRPPARRSKSLPIEDRVHIVWRDDNEELELPTRGQSKQLQPYVWEEAS